MKQHLNFSFDTTNRTWSFMDSNGRGINQARVALEVDGKTLTLDEADSLDVSGNDNGICVKAVFNDVKIHWDLMFDWQGDSSPVNMVCRISNFGKKAVSLEKCTLIDVASDKGELHLGKVTDHHTFFAFKNSIDTQWMDRLNSKEEHDSSPFCHIHDPDNDFTFFAGALTFDRMSMLHQVKYDKGNNRISEYQSYCSFAGYELKSGDTVESEVMTLRFDECPFRVLEEWADDVALKYNPPIPETAPVGWVGWSWVDGFKMETPESLAERNSAAIRTRLPGLPIDYFWMSIVNLKGGLPGNWLHENLDNFPNGLEQTLTMLKQRKFKPGLWVAPYYMNELADTFESNKDNLYKDADGNPVSTCNWLWASEASEDNLPRNFGMDPSNPASIEFFKHIFSAYREMGIRYFMLDFLSAGMPVGDKLPYDTAKIKDWEAYREGMKAIREAAGAETHLLTAVGSSIHNIGPINASRIGADYGEGRQLMPRFSSYPATYVINGTNAGSAGSPNQNAVQNLASWFFTHRRFFLNDSNLLSVDKPIPLSEARVSTTLFGISGSPIMLGDDIDRISDERLRLIKLCMPRSTSNPVPVDLFKRVQPEDYARVFSVPVETDWGKWNVMAVFNLDNTQTSLDISLDDLRLQSDTNYQCYDFWNERYLGLVNDTLTVEIPANSCALYRLEQEHRHPWLLATDMHIRMGEHELANVMWDDETLTLKGSAMRPAGETGNIFICAPYGFKPANHNGLWTAKDATSDTLIIRKEICFNTDVEQWDVKFARLTEEEKSWRNKGK